MAENDGIPVTYVPIALAGRTRSSMSRTESWRNLDYVDVAKSQLGTDLLDRFAENQAEYKAASQTDKATLKKEAFEKWMAYLLICGSDCWLYI